MVGIVNERVILEILVQKTTCNYPVPQPELKPDTFRALGKVSLASIEMPMLDVSDL